MIYQFLVFSERYILTEHLSFHSRIILGDRHTPCQIASDGSGQKTSSQAGVYKFTSRIDYCVWRPFANLPGFLYPFFSSRLYFVHLEIHMLGGTGDHFMSLIYYAARLYKVCCVHSSATTVALIPTRVLLRGQQGKQCIRYGNTLKPQCG